MATNLLNAHTLHRLSLRPIIFYFSIVVISFMTMFNHVHGEGIVTPSDPDRFEVCSLSHICLPMAGAMPALSECEAIATIVGIPEGMWPVRVDGGGCYTWGGNHYGQLSLIIGQCPANSTGSTTWNGTPHWTTTCTCNTGYIPDASKTNCISQQYIISLIGLGGNVKPTETRAAYALVTSGGSPKSGAQVTLSLTVAPDDDGQPYAAHVGTVSPNSGTTGADGRLNFVFAAPAAGGTHTITATCDSCTNNPVTGTIKVSGCPVLDLPPITDPEVQAFEDNPNRSDTARLTPRMQTALQCLLDRDSTATVGSAYRPPAYNQHLIEVWRKWVDQLVENENLACADLKAKIRGHFQRHSLLESQRPVPGSLHTQGEAVDVTINLPAANIDELAAGCQLRRPLPVNDRVHFIHQ